MSLTRLLPEKRISALNILIVDYVAKAKSLTVKEGRREWENAFNAHYIQPVLENLDQVLTDAVDIIANDDKQGMHYFGWGKRPTLLLVSNSRA